MDSPAAFFDGLSGAQLAWLAFVILVEGALFTVFPEEVVFITMGYLCRQGRVDPVAALLACQGGVLIANALMIGAGRTVGAKLAGMPPFRWFISKQALDRSLESIARNGWKIIAVTRFTPIIRGPIYLAAGLSKLPYWGCVGVDALASCIQVPLLMAAGYFAFDQANGLVNQLRIPVVIAGVLGLAFLVIRSRRPRRAALAGK